MEGQVGTARSRVDVAVLDGGLRLTVGAETLDVAAVWLRDHFTAPDSRDQVGGQRLLNIEDVPLDVRVARATEDGGTLRVIFAPDGHASDFDVAELVQTLSRTPQDDRNESGKRLWRSADDVQPVTRVPWSRYLADRAPGLRSVVRDGFALLSQVPERSGQVTAVAET